VGKRGGEGVDWFVKHSVEMEVSECGWEVMNRFVDHAIRFEVEVSDIRKYGLWPMEQLG
jgi:hypothetical protein